MRSEAPFGAVIIVLQPSSVAAQNGPPIGRPTTGEGFSIEAALRERGGLPRAAANPAGEGGGGVTTLIFSRTCPSARRAPQAKPRNRLDAKRGRKPLKTLEAAAKPPLKRR